VSAPASDSTPARKAHMSFTSHLMEMRARIVLSLIIIAVATALSWIFFDQLNALLLAPLKKAASEVEGASGAYPPITLAVHEAFVYVLKLGIVMGVVAASPIIIYEMWAFVSPGLTRSERRAMVPIFWLGLIFFLTGATVCYLWVLPTAIEYLIQVNLWVGSDLKARLRDYASFVIGLEVAFGVAFELPLVMSALARVGVVSPGKMLAQWRYMAVGAFVIGALLTPPDYVTCTMMAGCLIGLYALGLIFAYMSYPSDLKAGDSEAPENKKD